MPKQKDQPYFVCPACNYIITPQQHQNGKAEIFCGKLVHKDCPQKTLAMIREKVKRIFLDLADKISSIKDWAKEVIKEIGELTPDALWRVEIIIKKVINKLRELSVLADCCKDLNTKAVVCTTETKLGELGRCYFFWKRPELAR